TKSQKEEIAESTSDLGGFGDFLTNYDLLMNSLIDYIGLFDNSIYKFDNIENKMLTIDRMLYEGKISKEEHRIIREALGIREEMISSRMYVADTPKIVRLSRDLVMIREQIDLLFISQYFSDKTTTSNNI
ncbi:TPA: hypothetical protein QCZ12_004374, partial [Bacillus cereus]|nr:hypothetical protein [Bacillus cereus]